MGPVEGNNKNVLTRVRMRRRRGQQLAGARLQLTDNDTQW